MWILVALVGLVLSVPYTALVGWESWVMFFVQTLFLIVGCIVLFVLWASEKRALVITTVGIMLVPVAFSWASAVFGWLGLSGLSMFLYTNRFSAPLYAALLLGAGYYAMRRLSTQKA